MSSKLVSETDLPNGQDQQGGWRKGEHHAESKSRKALLFIKEDFGFRDHVLVDRCSAPLSQQPDCILQSCVLILIVVLGAEVLNFGLGEIQLCLRQLHDRGQTQVVAAL